MDVAGLIGRLPFDQRMPVALFNRLAGTDTVATVDAVDGRTHRYRDIAARADRVSVALRDAGVGPGDRVAWTAPTSVDSIAIWMGIAQLGAVDVCIGDAIKGTLLDHMMGDSAPVAVIGHRQSTGGVTLLDESTVDSLRAALWVGGSAPAGFTPVDLTAPGERIGVCAAIRPGDLATIVYTSGTTGPSKGVMLCHHHQVFVGANLVEQFRVHEGATLYHYSPFNHVTGRQLVVAAMFTNATLVIRDRFSLNGFWDDINTYAVTHSITLGSAVPLLLDQQGDRARNRGSLEYVWASPAMPEQYRRFADRFGLRVITPYGSTEVGIVVAPSMIPGDEGPPGNSGKQGPYFDLAILDENDEPAAPGALGEIAIRPRHPWTTFLGYLGRDAATHETNRNFWYHSGDHGRMDRDGYLFFADRKQDFLRSKGENISSSEVEQILVRHPAVADLAVIPVPSELADEDICVVVERSANESFVPDEFYRWCADEVPYFMVPRYVRVVDQLPRGASGKVEKFKLRAHGIDEFTWDAVAHGLRAGRSGIVSAPRAAS